MHEDDSQLLRQYIEQHSQQAFTHVVRRYAGIVYFAALRQTGKTHLAEEVSQRVFIALAGKAAKLRHVSVLSGWLLTTTRYEALNLIKMETRRLRHERKAAELRPETVPSAQDVHRSEKDWGQLSPWLDDAVETLASGRREALLLRYFEGKSMHEVAQRLGISEDAAKQRVSRAVEQLRAVFRKRGVVVPSAALTLMLASHAAQDAPASIVASIVASAGAPVTGSASAITGAGWKGWMGFMSTATKAKGVAVIIGIAAVAIPAASVTKHLIDKAHPDEEIVPLTDSSMVSPVNGGNEVGVSYSGFVRSVDGKPIDHADVLLGGDYSIAQVHHLWRQQAPQTQTSVDGHFAFTPQYRIRTIVVRCPTGYAEVPANGFQNGGEITVRPWGRIEGTASAGGRPLARRTIGLSGTLDGSFEMATMVDHQTTARTDDAGRFIFPQATFGTLWVAAQERGNDPSDPPVSEEIVRINVQPGVTTNVTLGGTGVRVSGRISAEDKLVFRGYLCPVAPRATTAAATEADTIRSTEPSAPYLYRIVTGKNGTFQAEDVPPGRYVFHLDSYEQPEGYVMGEHAATVSAGFTVSIDDQAAAITRAMDVGTFNASVNRRFKPGDPAPPFVAKLSDGKQVGLKDFAGRYLVLRFSHAPRLAWVDMPRDLSALKDRFPENRVAFLSIDLNLPAGGMPAPDRDAEAALTWPRATARPEGADRISEDYSAAPSPLFLIDPAGKLVTKWTSASQLLNILSKKIALPAPPGSASVTAEHHDPARCDPSYTFHKIPPISKDDAAAGAIFTVIDGRSPEGVTVAALSDGQGGKNIDDPKAAFFFDGSLEGRLRVDLGRSMAIERVGTYSWHKSTRCPQVYLLFGSDGTAPNFDPTPKIGLDPLQRGWSLIAGVDTRGLPSTDTGRPTLAPGGQDGVAVTGISHPFRYLLFEMFVTETEDSFGHTFYNEIDVIERK